MRMWNVNPRIMCTKHLCGEHYEIHKIVGSLNKNKNLDGFIKNNLIEIHNIRKRHKELVVEMLKRKYNHNSKLSKFKEYILGKIDISKNLIELQERCEECCKKIRGDENG